MPSGKPNIVFVHCDSMDGRVMGCMGHPAAHTPNLDRLADRGTMFRNTYTNNPICCPSRASMWSGLYTHKCEGWNNYKGLSPDDPTFMTHLERAGYRCGVFGKTDYLSGRHTIRARVTAWTRSANIYLPGYRMSGPVVDESNAERVHTGDWQRVDKSVEWLNENSGKTNEPFVLYCGISKPHPAFETSRRWLDLIDPSKVSLPDKDTSSHEVMHYMRVVKNWQHGLSNDRVHLVRRIYFAMIAEVDAMVGRLMQEVDRLGLGDRTYFIFSSDHGEMNMEHQQFYKMNHYEASARVPLIIAGPEVRRGEAVDDLVSLVDMYPTLMDMAELDHPDGLDGHSLLPALHGQASDGPDCVLSEFHDSTSNTGAFMLRRGQWKYIEYVGYDPLLFDLDADPDELADQTRARPDVADQMNRALREIVDYQAVDAKAKQYDKGAFTQWRDEQREEGSYIQNMSCIFSGWDDLGEADISQWTGRHEDVINQWLTA